MIFLAITGTVKPTGPKQETDDDIENTDSDRKIQAGPVRFNIVGDTSHLFADEDFEKQEAILLGNESEDSINTEQSNHEENSSEALKFYSNEAFKNLTQNSNPETKLNCTTPSLTINRTQNSVQIVNGSTLTKHLNLFTSVRGHLYTT